MNFPTEQLLDTAERQLALGQVDAAIETLRQVLSSEPDLAVAHALLALGLVDKKRLHAAAHEAGQALALDPEESYVQYAAAHVALARREFERAERHITRALQINPDASSFLLTAADIAELTNDKKQAQSFLQEAAAKDPESANVWAALARFSQRAGERAKCYEYADKALQLEPQNTQALVAKGYALLADNQIQDAMQHCRWALANNAENESALGLLTAIKARSNWFLGLWWRFNQSVGAGGMGRTIVILLGMYLLYRAMTIFLVDQQMAGASTVLTALWLGFVAYTWFAPVIFMRMLKKELEQISLKHDF